MWLPVCLLCNLSASSTTWSLARNFRFSTIDWGRHKMLPMTHTSLFLSFIPFLHNIAAALFVWGLPFFNDVIKKFKYFVVYGEEASRGLQIWLFFRAILLQQHKKKKQCNDWERPEKLFLDSNKYATHEISTRARKKKFIKTSKRRKKERKKIFAHKKFASKYIFDAPRSYGEGKFRMSSSDSSERCRCGWKEIE